jgi:hypothetical protein
VERAWSIENALNLFRQSNDRFHAWQSGACR